jgi:hypothetical protein
MEREVAKKAEIYNYATDVSKDGGYNNNIDPQIYLF